MNLKYVINCKQNPWFFCSLTQIYFQTLVLLLQNFQRLWVKSRRSCNSETCLQINVIYGTKRRVFFTTRCLENVSQEPQLIVQNILLVFLCFNWNFIVLTKYKTSFKRSMAQSAFPCRLNSWLLSGYNHNNWCR